MTALSNAPALPPSHSVTMTGPRLGNGVFISRSVYGDHEALGTTTVVLLPSGEDSDQGDTRLYTGNPRQPILDGAVLNFTDSMEALQLASAGAEPGPVVPNQIRLSSDGFDGETTVTYRLPLPADAPDGVVQAAHAAQSLFDAMSILATNPYAH